MDYQKIVLVGNVTANAERRESKKGDVVFTTLRVGVGDGKGRTTFFPVSVFGKLGEAVAKHVTKGREVLVEGRIEVSENRYFNVVANRVVFGARPETKVADTAIKSEGAQKDQA